MLKLTLDPCRIFRITHIDNVGWILLNGLHCRNSNVVDPSFREIGNADLISKRHARKIDLGSGGTLSDYIPFYYTPWTPMLYNIKTGWQGMRQTPMSDIVIFVASLQDIAAAGVKFIISDRHAYLAAATFSNDLTGLHRLDWPLWQKRDFRRDPDDPGKMERYQAEALIHRHLPTELLSGIICYTEEQRSHVSRLAREADQAIKVAAKSECYL